MIVSRLFSTFISILIFRSLSLHPNQYLWYNLQKELQSKSDDFYTNEKTLTSAKEGGVEVGKY